MRSKKLAKDIEKNATVVTEAKSNLARFVYVTEAVKEKSDEQIY